MGGKSYAPPDLLRFDWIDDRGATTPAAKNITPVARRQRSSARATRGLSFHMDDPPLVTCVGHPAGKVCVRNTFLDFDDAPRMPELNRGRTAPPGGACQDHSSDDAPLSMTIPYSDGAADAVAA